MTADCRQSTVLMGFHAFASLSIRRFCAHSVSGLSAPACVSPSSVCLLGAVVFVAMLSEAGWCKSPTDFQKLKIEMICSKGQVWYIYLHSSTESRRCRSWWCWAAGRCSGFTLTSHTSIWEQTAASASSTKQGRRCIQRTDRLVLSVLRSCELPAVTWKAQNDTLCFRSTRGRSDSFVNSRMFLIVPACHFFKCFFISCFKLTVKLKWNLFLF